MLHTIGFNPVLNQKQANTKNKNPIVKKLYTHSCAVGQTGCGKTTSFIYPNLQRRIADGDGILFFDYKGKEHQAVKHFAKLHNRLDDVVEIGKDWGEKINLLKYATDSELTNFLYELVGLNDGKNDFWANSAVSVGMSINKIIRTYSKFVSVYNKSNLGYAIEDMLYDTFNKEQKECHNVIPTQRNLKSLHDITSSLENISLFAKNIKNIADVFRTNFRDKIIWANHTYNYIEHDTRVKLQKKYASIVSAVVELESVIYKSQKALASFENIKNAQNSNTNNSILMSLNKPIYSLASISWLNNDEFDIVNALNNNKIIIINTQEFSDAGLSFFAMTLFNELKKRIIYKNQNSISVFIDEAQRVLNNKFELPIDILREARIDLFLSYQNDELMINKLGENNYKSLYKNIANKYVFANSITTTSSYKLSTFEYYDMSVDNKTSLVNHTKFKAKPIFISNDELFEADLAYQNNKNLLRRYNMQQELYRDYIIINDSNSFFDNKIVLQSKYGKTIIHNITNLQIQSQVDTFFGDMFAYIERERDSEDMNEIYENNSSEDLAQLFRNKLQEYQGME